MDELRAAQGSRPPVLPAPRRIACGGDAVSSAGVQLSVPAHFFEQLAGDGGDGVFRATELTRGPWDGASQHAGPPSALIARAIELCPGIGEGPEDRSIGRLTFEILRPVPIADLHLEARVARPGRRVEMLEATLSEAGDAAAGGAPGRELVRARGWRIAAAGSEIPPGLTSTEPGGAPARAGRPSGAVGAPTPPLELEPEDVFFPTGHDVGYHRGMEYRFESGGFMETGPAVCWMRMRAPLVAGEEPSPLQRVLVAADSGNGISSTLDFHRFIFINVDLTVHLHRMPSGEWVCLDSLTIPEPNGQGMSDTLLADERGPIGRACQTLLVTER